VRRPRRGEWPEIAREAALELSGGDATNVKRSTGVQLLDDIRAVFEDDKMSCSGLVTALNFRDDMPDGGWNEDGIKTRELGQKLEPYGIKASAMRIGEWRGERPDAPIPTAVFNPTGRLAPTAPAIWDATNGRHLHPLEQCGEGRRAGGCPLPSVPMPQAFRSASARSNIRRREQVADAPSGRPECAVT
jgi:hypothetical protein